jgi:hypothetical protein
VVFLVDKAALGQVFLRVLRFSPVNIIPSWLFHTHISFWGVKNMFVGDRSSEA